MELKELRFFYEEAPEILQRIEHHDKNHRRQGNLKSFYKDGRIYFDVNYKNDELHGSHKTISYNGLIQECTFINGMKEYKEDYYILVDEFKKIFHIWHFRRFQRFGEQINFCKNEN